MKRLLTLATVFGIAAAMLSPAPANASILGKYLTFDGLPDTIRTSSLGLFDFQDNTKIQVGDVIAGAFRVNQISPTGSINNENLWAIYSYEVAGFQTVDVLGADRVLIHTQPVTSGNLKISSMLEAIGFAPGGLTGLRYRAGTLDQATIAIVEKAQPNILEDALVAGPPLVAGGLFGGEIGAANGWSLSMVLGLLDDSFHQLRLTQGFSIDTGDNSVSLAPLANTDEFEPGTLFAQYRGAYTVLEDSFGEPYLSLVRNDFLGNAVEADMISSGSNNIGLANEHASRGWHLQNTGNYDINPTPEPASAVVWMLLIGVVALGGRRLRRR